MCMLFVLCIWDHDTSYKPRRPRYSSVKTSPEILWLGQRFRLKHSTHASMNRLWAQTTMRHVTIDTFINKNNDSCDQATKALRNARYEDDWQYIQSLQLQGALKSVSPNHSAKQLSKNGRHSCLMSQHQSTNLCVKLFNSNCQLQQT